jgi:signal transduction histidine kinase
MHAEVLKRTVRDDAAAEDSLRTVLQQLGRLAEMLPAAFYVASLERGPSATVDLGAIAAVARRAAGGTLQLAAGTWPKVVGDAGLLTEALTQLFRNAVEATAAAGSGRPPEAHAVVGDGATQVTVRDWGPGLPTTNANLLIRLLHSTKPGHRGLGLVTVERIARLHGGSLTFESPDDGAIATLTLPEAK